MKVTMKRLDELLYKLNSKSKRVYAINETESFTYNDKRIFTYSLKVIRGPFNEDYIFTLFNTRKQMEELLIILISYADLEKFKDLDV